MVNTVAKSIRILELLSQGNYLGVTEIGRELEIPKSSAHSILETLLHFGMVEKNTESGKFQLGMKLIELGNRAQIDLDICRIARPYMNGINMKTDETVYLTILQHDEALYVDCVESKKRLRSYSGIGITAPLYCTGVGKAILAFQDPEYIDSVIKEKGLPKFTEHTITDEDRLLDELSKIREQGYAVDNMEHEEELRCVGAPIYNSRGEVFAAISIAGPIQRNTIEKIPELAELVKNSTKDISRKIGYRL